MFLIIMTLINTVLLLLLMAGGYWLYRKSSQQKSEVVYNPPPEKHIDDAPIDNKATNDERRYMEGIQAILNYNVDTMKSFLKGEDET